jgi:hypothetical protein
MDRKLQEMREAEQRLRDQHALRRSLEDQHKAGRTETEALFAEPLPEEADLGELVRRLMLRQLHMHEEIELLRQETENLTLGLLSVMRSVYELTAALEPPAEDY